MLDIISKMRYEMVIVGRYSLEDYYMIFSKTGE